MAALARRIYRERRRAGFVALLATISGFFFYSHVPATVSGIPFAVFAGVMYGICFGFATLVVSLLAPNLRFAMEAFAVARLLFALVAGAVPAVGIATASSPFLNATVVVLGGILIARIAYAETLARRFVRPQAVTVLRVNSGATGTPCLTPPEGTLARLGYTPNGTGPRALLHRVAMDAARASASVAREDRRRRDRLVLSHRALPWSAWAAAWIDDAHGRLYDASIASAAPVVSSASGGLTPA